MQGVGHGRVAEGTSRSSPHLGGAPLSRLDAKMPLMPSGLLRRGAAWRWVVVGGGGEGGVSARGV